MKTSRGLATLAFAAVLCAAGGSAYAQQIAVADGTPQIDQEIADGRLSQALADLDRRIASNPSDVQAKFKRATVLARLNRDDEAITAFTAITQQYPELPEPYNNLAALYAKHGQLGQARTTLETAVAANPAYALGRQNLASVYLRLSLESYQEAVKRDPHDTLSAQRVQQLTALLNQAQPKPETPASAASAPVASSAAFGPQSTLFSPWLNPTFGH
jgi:Flp pilus assembly protein TadD